MKTLENHTILYDEVCPMCNTYTNAFVKTKMLDKAGRESYQKMPSAWAGKIDCKRAVNEIALVNRNNGEVFYGIKSLFIIIQNAFPVFKPLFGFKPFIWLMDKFYKFISYNRRVIMPPGKETTGNLNDPSFNMRYRVTYLVFTWLTASYILFNYTTLLQGVIPESNFYREFWICGGQVLWQLIVVSFTNKSKAWDYLGTLMTISFAGSLLLVIAIAFSQLFTLPPFVFVIYFLVVAGLMLVEHIRRMKILQLNSYLTITWILYRIILLIFIIYV
jgi:predicted DCC family thiol-disulfide oxidoreductase YuxK